MSNKKNIEICIESSNTKIKKSNKKYLKENDNIKNKKKLSMIDLCAGTGAFTHAFESTNKVDVIFANDIEQSSKNIYDLNFKHKLTLGNICDIDVQSIPPHDILSAGFPCQPFSIAGKQKGFDDVRSNVFWKILEIVKYHKPHCIILENVKNLSSHDNGDTLKTIKNSLKIEKYHIIHKVLNTSDITTIPQHRERIYIVCVKNKKLFDDFNLDFPNVKKQKISKMLTNIEVNNKYYYNDENNNIHKMIMEAVTNNETIYQFRRIYVRENKNNECPTLTANMGTGGHNVPIILDNVGARKLIPRECFNFQGFPKEYILPNLSDCKLYKLAGNAVSVPVVNLIANRLIPKLYDTVTKLK
jgi:DNA (cytosine-5)-methyltransferase 1